MGDIDAVDIESIGPFEKVPLCKPEMREGTHVFINNKEHKLHLEQGVVVARDHRRYRIKFISKNKAINESCLWVPEHWVDPIPKKKK